MKNMLLVMQCRDARELGTQDATQHLPNDSSQFDNEQIAYAYCAGYALVTA